MQYTTDSSHCPKCGHTYMARRKRSLWMRLIGVSKFYRCEACRAHVLFREPKNTESE